MLIRNLLRLGPLLLVVLLESAYCTTTETPISLTPPPRTSTPVPKEVLVEVENNLLTLFGMQKKPKIDRSKIVIPEAMLRLYEQQIGHPYDTVAIPRPGLHTTSANTVRSFSHIGKL